MSQLLNSDSETTFLGPETTFLGPETKFLGPETKFLGPETKFLGPETKFLEKILFISSKIKEDQQKIIDKIDELDKRMTLIENKVDITIQLAKKGKCNPDLFNSVPEENIVELKRETLNISENETVKALNYRDYRSVLYLFKLYYKNKTNKNYVYPIRVIGKRSYEYYANNKWNSDLYGHFIMNTICQNIENLFLTINNLDEYGDLIDDEDFIPNQNFINKLSVEKFKKELFRNIIDEVKLNSVL